MVLIAVHCKSFNLVQIQLLKLLGVRNGMAGMPQILRRGGKQELVERDCSLQGEGVLEG